MAVVLPGYLNGIAPFLRDVTTGEERPIDDPIPPSFSASAAVRDEPVYIPEFFRRLGALPDESIQADTETLSLRVVQDARADAARRYLRACDLVLSTPRPALDGKVAVENGSVVYVSQVRAPDRTTAHIFATPKWVEPRPPTLLDRLLGTSVDYTMDEMLLGTLYFLSPPGVEYRDKPLDSAWQPYVKHAAFWNLNHASLSPTVAATPPKLTFVTGLAGGAANAVMASILDPLNSESEKALAAISQIAPEGRFWSV